MQNMNNNQQPQIIIVRRSSNGLGITSLVCAIIGFIIGLVPLLWLIVEVPMYLVS